MMLIALVTALLWAGQTSAGSSSNLSGIVFDQQRAAIPRAEIRITCGTERHVLQASEAGRFSAAALPAGPCSIAAAAPLFEPETIRLTLSGQADVAIVLRVRPVETELTVTAQRGILQEASEVPRAISATTRADIDARPYQLLPQVLREEPGVLVQQTTTAQASPIIRGFTGQSNVYLVDGVRLNTAAWRTGPSQYFSWLDPDAVERLEIVRGPGSVQYGSDALGGSINVLSSLPSFSLGGLRVGGGANAMVGSADTSRGGSVNLAVQAPRVAFRFGLGTRDVNDLRTGRNRDSHAAVTRFLGLPSDTLSTRLQQSGFRQSGGFLTGSIRAGDRATVNTVFVHQHQTGASRYDRVYGGDGLYRSGFDPQTLDFLSVRYRRHGFAGFDDVSATVSLNRQADGRFEQTRPAAVRDSQRAVTAAYGYQADAKRRLGSRHRLSVGADVYDESIEASREQTDPTGARVPLRPDIPDGTGYTTVGVFAQDTFAMIPDRLTLQGGIRFGRFAFSTMADPAFGVSDERVSADALTFDAGTVLRLAGRLHVTFAVSRGFRAANAADLGAVGLTGGGGFEIAPSTAAGFDGEVGDTSAAGAMSTGLRVPQLGPEIAYSYEPGLRFQHERLSASFSVFDVEYLDAIQRRAVVFPSGIVGTVISGFTVVRQDSTGLAYIAEDQRPIGTRVNIDRARIRGFDAEGTYRFSARWRARAFYSMSNGRLSTGEFMRRMPPPLGAASLRWNGGDDRWWLEGVLTFAQDQRRLNPGDIADARIGGLRTRAAIGNYFNGTATDLGLVVGGVLVATSENLAAVQNRVLGTAASAPLYPSQSGFAAIGLRAAWRFSPHVEAVVVGENLTDRNYRLMGSGVDAPGANVQVRLRYRF